MPSPLQIDPTRTTMLRRSFLLAMKRRFARFKRANYQLVVVEDAFGLKDDSVLGLFSSNRLVVNTLTVNKRWQFRSDADKVAAYREWLRAQMDTDILGAVGGVPGEPWTAEYIDSAYKRGLVNSYTEAHKEDLLRDSRVASGSQAEFLRDAFGGPVSQQRLQLLNTRVFTDLRGVTEVMGTQLSRTLSNGFVNGLGPRAIAREMSKNIDGINRQRANTIARTEIISSYNEAQLDGYEKMNVENVGVMAEWSTAGDDLVCPLCYPLEGVVLKVKEARGILPRHPNCRCSWIPAFDDIKDKGQKRSKAEKKQAIDRSIKAGKKKGESLEEARQSTSWFGGELKPAGVPAGTPLQTTARKTRRIAKKKRLIRRQPSKTIQGVGAPAPELWNHQTSEVIRWMGAQGWDIKDAERVLRARGITPSKTALKNQFKRGQEGLRGVAALTEEQAAALRALRAGDITPPKPPVVPPKPPKKVVVPKKPKKVPLTDEEKKARRRAYRKARRDAKKGKKLPSGARELPGSGVIPPHITYTGGEPTEFAKKVWKEIGSGGYKTEDQIKAVGKMVQEEFNRRATGSPSLTLRRKMLQLEAEATKEMANAMVALKKRGITDKLGIAKSQNLKEAEWAKYRKVIEKRKELEKLKYKADTGQLMREVLGEIRDFGGKVKTNAYSELEAVSLLSKATDRLPIDWVNSMQKLEATVVDRGCFNGLRQTIKVSGYDETQKLTCSVHEMVHAASYKNPKMAYAELKFRARRVKGYPEVTIRVGPPREYGWKDKFKDSYTGRKYDGLWHPEPTEILTTGLEDLLGYGDSAGRYVRQDDDDFRHFCLGAVAGF